MKGLLILLSLLIVSSADDQKELFMKILKTLCVPNLAPDLDNKAKECEKAIPDDYMAMFRGCASMTLGVPELVLPLMCYRAFPGAPQLTQCMDNREKAKGMDPKEKDRFSAEYSECLKTLI